jgi:hypothetical protein
MSFDKLTYSSFVFPTLHTSHEPGPWPPTRDHSRHHKAIEHTNIVQLYEQDNDQLVAPSLSGYFIVLTSMVVYRHNVLEPNGRVLLAFGST